MTFALQSKYSSCIKRR